MGDEGKPFDNGEGGLVYLKGILLRCISRNYFTSIQKSITHTPRLSDEVVNYYIIWLSCFHTAKASMAPVRLYSGQRRNLHHVGGILKIG